MYPESMSGYCADLHLQALDPTSVYTLAAGFIKSCPSSNPALPFKPFPTLSIAMKSSKKHSGWKKHSKSAPIPCAGDKVEFTAASAILDGSYVTFVSGLSVVSVKGESKGKSASLIY